MMKTSNPWKLIALVLPILGTVALAAFTSPPFGGYPAQTVPMVWQCYSGLVERTSAVCAVLPYHPISNGYHAVTNVVSTNVFPSRTHWYLVQCKSAAQSLITGNWWAHPAWPVTAENRLDLTNICALASVGTDFWTNTPPAGMSTATNGWNGLMRVITNLKWIVAQGVVNDTDCGGRTNVAAELNETRCDPLNAETNYSFSKVVCSPWQQLCTFPLYEARRYSPTTNVTYQGYSVTKQYVAACLPDGDVPDWWSTNDVNSAGTSMPDNQNCFPHTTNDWSNCTGLPATNRHSTTTDDGDCDDNTICVGWRATFQETTYFVTNTITDPCAPGYICDLPSIVLASHLSPITFDNCTNRTPTNIVMDFEFWFNTGATGTAAGADAVFTDPFGYGMTGTNWGPTNLFSSTSLLMTNLTICHTNFATTNRVPWAGNTTTNPMAWAVYDALLVKKPRFNY